MSRSSSCRRWSPGPPTKRKSQNGARGRRRGARYFSSSTSGFSTMLTPSRPGTSAAYGARHLPGSRPPLMAGKIAISAPSAIGVSRPPVHRQLSKATEVDGHIINLLDAHSHVPTDPQPAAPYDRR